MAHKKKNLYCNEMNVSKRMREQFRRLKMKTGKTLGWVRGVALKCFVLDVRVRMKVDECVGEADAGICGGVCKRCFVTYI